MPDVQEIFRIATQNVHPDTGFVDRQIDRQRRRVRNRQTSAIAAVAAISVLAAVLVVRALAGGEAQPAARSRTTASPVAQASAAPEDRPFADESETDLTVDVPLAMFESSLYPYSIGYPDIWTVRAATRSLTDLGLPVEWARGTDYFSAPGRKYPPSYPSLIVAAQPLDPGTTIRAWTSEVELFVDRCGPPASRETVRVGEERAILAYFPGCYFQGRFQYWTTIVHNGMGYHVIWTGNTGDEARDRAVLDRVLETFGFTR